MLTPLPALPKTHEVNESLWSFCESPRGLLSHTGETGAVTAGTLVSAGHEGQGLGTELPSLSRCPAAFKKFNMARCSSSHL